MIVDEIHHVLLRNHLAVNSDTLTEINEMRGRVESDPITGFLQDGGNRVRARSFTVRSGDVNGSEQTVRMSEMLIEKVRVFQSFLICCSSHILKHGNLREEIVGVCFEIHD